MTKKFKKHTPGKEGREKTVGELIIEQENKKIEGDVPVQELIDEAHKDWEKQVLECIDNGKKAYPNRDFFVVVLHKVERIYEGISRLFWLPRLTCPTPTFDQVVYKYHYGPEMLEFIWVIPDREVCQAYRDDPLSVPDEEKELRQFVLDFYDGTLDRKCKTLNNEKQFEQRVAIRIDEVN